MVEKDPQISALDVGELDIFIDSMDPSRIESIGNHAYVSRFETLSLFFLKYLLQN